MARILLCNEDGVISVSNAMIRAEAVNMAAHMRRMSPPGVKVIVKPV